VFKLERRWERVKDRQVTQEVVYGITSLMADEADPERLLSLVQAQWGIENGLHYRRDETLREDWCRVRMGQAAEILTLINNLVIGLLLRHGVKNVPEARRRFAAHLDEAVQVILHCPV
jgi:predicted transposase YbfD/YdcC